MFDVIAFYFFAGLVLASFIIVVRTKQPLFAMTALAFGMVFISAFFFLLGADFLGAVQIVVYTGAVMVVYAFGMMFFDTSKAVVERQRPKILLVTLGVLLALAVALALSAPIIGENLSQDLASSQDLGNTEALGVALFTKYLLPFELAAVMLLVAMIGGIVLASSHMNKEKE